MVVKRQCSFCADEIEPGTGTMFVKRDGTVFHFCSSSCRKQQLHLGRVGHRLKWTRAHALKRAADQRSGIATAAPKSGAPAPRPPTKPSAGKAGGTGRPRASAKPAESAAGAEAKKSDAAKQGSPPQDETSSTPAKKPRSRKAKSEDSAGATRSKD